MSYLTFEKLCQELDIKVNRVTAWRWRKEGMPYIKVGKQIRYDKDKVIKWMEDHDK